MLALSRFLSAPLATAGSREPVSFDKIIRRVQTLVEAPPRLSAAHVDPALVAQKVVEGVYDGVGTAELDGLAAETAASLVTAHPDYGLLGARIAVSNLHKQTPARFGESVEMLAAHVARDGRPAPLVSDELLATVRAHAGRLDAAVDPAADYRYDYFGFRTLERSYLLRIDGRVVERPQYMLLRVALGIHGDDLEAALETYGLLAAGRFTHATPTLFNAGTPQPQLSSCFLLGVREDSIEGIYDTVRTCALISKAAGGIGFHCSDVRASGAYIRGTNGTSNGLVPMLRVFNDTARYVDQGGGKRKGAFACYLEPWHADVFEWLDLKKNHGAEELRARDLFYALWVPDLFMRRVESDGAWSLMCPSECPGLAGCHGAEFDALYARYEAEGKARRTVRAQELWFAIIQSQMETGTPYMLYKDACNAKSNQQNLGTIRSSNLCTEVVQYSCPGEVAVCNLASLALPTFVAAGPDGPEVDHAELARVTGVVCRNLNRVIDRNRYPVPEAEASNLRHRPIGIGVQGLADLFLRLGLPWESEGARRVNREVFETIYYGALRASCDLARADGPYASFAGSPASEGRLQFDLWGVAPPTDRWDWAGLRADVRAHGLRNSLLVAPMPTASTAQILGNNECIEPYTSNIMTRRVLSGDFVVVNQHLLRELVRRGLWSEDLKTEIIRRGGSVQGVPGVPMELQQLYKTVWELPAKLLLDMAVERGPFIDQSQSLNVFMAHPTAAKLTSMHFYGWHRGLKTGQYYLRTKAAAAAVQFTVTPAGGQVGKESGEVGGESCEACGS